MHWRRKWQPTPVFLPGESKGQQNLVGCHLWGSHRVGHNWSDLAAAVVWPLYLGIWQEPQKCVVQNQSVITQTCFLPNLPWITSLHPSPACSSSPSVLLSAVEILCCFFSQPSTPVQLLMVQNHTHIPDSPTNPQLQCQILAGGPGYHHLLQYLLH